MNINQYLFLVGSSFLLSNRLCDYCRKSYNGSKFLFALIFPVFWGFSRFSSLYLLRYSHELPIGLICMEKVICWGQLAIELRNEVFICIWGNFLRFGGRDKLANDLFCVIKSIWKLSVRRLNTVRTWDLSSFSRQSYKLEVCRSFSFGNA